MKYDYDSIDDILIIRIDTGKLHHGVQKGNVISHYSKEGKLLQLEILDASKEAVHMIHSILKSKQSIAADSD